ncbi:UDP-N-acetylglucosamine 2-epimerase [Asaccharospora irregularis]|uniref:UDP-N-acetylglucosamine 2-epimerase n=1 Tax=Asaccharospora irregularis DSM 2635 TaxID=1121321 RepID=A0A1M5PFM1_9FIRM|nr:UDP-N-acetylglucosamine 2-epimerase [Asaccharospora irregularis]SHH00530.1 UDP-N-acetylglucosamine 2-epimerase [Asaccharospora irregularis DSM 2635]
MKKCLFVSYGGGHVNTIIPIIKELYKFDDIEVVSIGINLAAETLRKNRIPCKTLSSYMSKEVLQVGAPLAEQFHNFDSNVSFADSIAYYGFSMRDLINEKGNEVARKVFEVYDRRLFLPINAMKEILQKEKPDVVVATTMHRFEAASLIAACELGIPSLRVEDLLGNINKPFPDKIHVDTADERDQYIAKGFKKESIILKSQIDDPDIQEVANEVYEKYCKLQPTKFAVLCKYTKNNIANRGINPDSVIVTGQPAFDKLLEFKNLNKMEMCKKLGIDSSKTIVSLMSQPIDSRENVLKALIHAMKEHENKQLIIKLHPNEDGKIQQVMLDEMGYKAIIVKDIEAPKIIELSDLVITVSSTTGLEAVVMDKPLISINLTGEPDFIPYNDMGIGLGVYDKEELSKTISLIFEDSEVVEKLKEARQEFATDGKAASRVAELIIEMLRVEK